MSDWLNLAVALVSSLMPKKDASKMPEGQDKKTVVRLKIAEDSAIASLGRFLK